MAKNSKAPKSKPIDLERETRVLLEEIRQQVQTVAEGHGDIMRKLEEHDKKFEQIDQRFDKIEMVLTDTNERVNDHGQRLDRIEMVLTDTNEKVNDRGQRLDRIEMVLTDTNERVKSIEKNLGLRITKLEEKVLA